MDDTNSLQRALEVIHQNFAGFAASILTGKQIKTGIAAGPVDHCTFEDFKSQIQPRSIIGTIIMNPLDSKAIITIDPSTSFLLLELLLGGTGSYFQQVHREHTHMELSIMMGVIVRLLGAIRQAWLDVIDLRPRLEQLATDTRFIVKPHPDDLLYISRFTVTIGKTVGMITLGIASLATEPLKMKLLEYAKLKIETGTGLPGGNDRPVGAASIFETDEMDMKQYLGAIRAVDPKVVKKLIELEHPQAIALVLSYLDDSSSSAIIARLNRQVREDVTRRIAEMRRVPLEVIREVDRILEQRLEMII